MNWKKLASLGVVAMMSLSILGCGSDTASNDKAASSSSLSGSITGSGSSALLPLAKDAADKFKELHPEVSITLNGGGSGTGLKQVADGSVDIGNSDVAADTKLDKAVADGLVDHKVCVVTMAPVVNKDIAATVKSLTKQQLTDIFTAKITNWKEVGGPDEEIVLITRPSTSGTRALFKEFALGGAEEASNKSLETDDSGTLLQSIKDNKGAIGYVALSYLVNNQDVATISVDGVAPTLENTYNGTYPVWGYEHMYTKGEPNATVKAYLDFIMSDEYGKSMEAQGYGVTSKMQVQR
ncbi:MULTISPECIES: phosphate ABC transporter substrate-binding protein [Megamonas]|uniref:phosphate ABC transporter substrate-binding protein n=1 Tax=Megamonas TaxID=158846 RepID=UPI001EC0AA29|nr:MULTISPECIES: phosphate ABC transporter substrate-binding protein [Megamonas]MBS7211453.1 phosphate ABC transporter substrate-binding protein [Megamonas funiformis]